MAPTHLQAPSGSRIALDYADAATPVLAVRLQEVFGLLDTPRIGGGKVPLLLHLLSPASRPVQVTRDLRSFWENTWPEVRKDMKGRYPKHPWPEDPWSAPATAATATAGLRRTKRVATLPPVRIAASAAPVSTQFNGLDNDAPWVSRLARAGRLESMLFTRVVFMRPVSDPLRLRHV